MLIYSHIHVFIYFNLSFIFIQFIYEIAYNMFFPVRYIAFPCAYFDMRF